MVINIFDNSYIQGISGGNIRAAQIFKHLKRIYPDIQFVLVGSRNCLKFYKKIGLYEKFMFSSKEKNARNFYLLYFLRICRLTLWSLVGKFRNQTIYANSDYLVDVIPAFLSKLLYNTKWVQVCQLIIAHPNSRENSLNNYFAYYCQRISFVLMKKANVIITDGYYIRDTLIRKFNFDAKLLRIGFLGVDLEAINEAPLGIKFRDLLFVGSTDNRKGIKDFINVCVYLAERGLNFKAGIIGNNYDEGRQLETILQELGILQHVDIFGQLEQKELFTYLKNSGILLFPSHNESWALVVSEAVACGAMVIARDLAVYKEIYNDHIIYCRTISEFCEKTSFYLKDKKARQEVVERAKIFISRYSWFNVAKREFGFIKEVATNYEQ